MQNLTHDGRELPLLRCAPNTKTNSPHRDHRELIVVAMPIHSRIFSSLTENEPE